MTKTFNNFFVTIDSDIDSKIIHTSTQLQKLSPRICTSLIFPKASFRERGQIS